MKQIIDLYDINFQYRKLLREVYDLGIVTAPRGKKIKEIIPYSFAIDPHKNVITLDGVKTNLQYANLELDWYYAATNNIHWSDKIAKIWNRFSDDGKTVNSAYGHRIFGGHEEFINQWEWIKDKLTEDPDSRQCVMNINWVKDKEKPTKDFPCTVYIQIFIRDNKLIWITNMRSNDVYFGLRNDVYCFCEMQKRLAKELGIECGLYHHYAGSMHLYEEQFEKVEKFLEVKQ